MLETLFRNLYPNIPSQLELFARKLQDIPEKTAEGWMAWDSDMRLHALTLKTLTLNLLESMGATSEDLFSKLILRRLRTYVNTEEHFSALYASHMPSEETAKLKPNRDEYENPVVDGAIINLSRTLFFQSINVLGVQANRLLKEQGYTIKRKSVQEGEQLGIETTKGAYEILFTKLRSGTDAFINLIPRNQDAKIVS